MSECHICSFVAQLEAKADVFTAEVVRELSVFAVNIWRPILVLWFAYVCVFVYIGLKKYEPAKIGSRVFLAVILSALISSTAAGTAQNDPTHSIYWKMTHELYKKVSAGVSSAILSMGGGIEIPDQSAALAGAPAVSLSTNSYPFTRVFGAMENSVWNIIVTGIGAIWSNPSAATNTANQSWFVKMLGLPGIQQVVNVIQSILLLLPYVFVIGLFTAYIVESLFMYLATTMVAPFLMICAFFDPLRQIFITGLRIYASAALTIIFAAMAMGFTLSVSAGYFSEIQCLIVKEPTITLASGKTATCSSATIARTDPVILSYEYWSAVLIGFASILLHIKAKTLASNFSGASDGAGPAAAVVAATKLAVGGALAAGLSAARQLPGNARDAAGLGMQAVGAATGRPNLISAGRAITSTNRQNSVDNVAARAMVARGKSPTVAAAMSDLQTPGRYDTSAGRGRTVNSGTAGAGGGPAQPGVKRPAQDQPARRQTTNQAYEDIRGKRGSDGSYRT